MPGEFPTAFAAATRVPLYPSDAHEWDVHNDAAVSPTMHLLPVAKRLEDMVGSLFVDFVKTVDSNYASMLERAEALRAEFSNEVESFSTRIGERLGVIETVLDGKLSEELDPVFTKWLGGMSFAPANAQPNVIETVKVNGKPLNVVSKSVDVTVPDAYSKSETDAMLDEKSDKATTLAGYGITDAATKSELDSVDQSVANAISGVQSELSTKADLVGGKVPAAQLPAFVDDVLEYDAVSAFPATGEDGKIYVAKNTNKTYRWGGTQYVEISPSLALGETSETAYPGDKGAANASAVAALKKSKQDALDAQQLSAVNSGVTAEKISNMVTKDDVVPKGSGTETIATIGGKDIKAPASPVSSVNGKTGAVKLVAFDVGALALGSSNKVGSSFSMDFEGEEASGGNLLFGVGFGPAGRTFIANKLYCSDRLYANGFVITNTSGAPGESVLNRIQEYGGDYKTALREVNDLIGAALDATAAYPMSTVVDGALKDRTVNHATAGGTFTFPARTGTNARDFVLVIDALETAPTVTFPGSFTYVSEQDAADIWTAEAGKVNAWYFSEVADGVVMVCHKAMGAVAQ